MINTHRIRAIGGIKRESYVKSHAVACRIHVENEDESETGTQRAKIKTNINPM